MIYSFAEELLKNSIYHLNRNLQVSFLGEDGIDQGGLRAELYTKLSMQLFDPSFGLFKLTPNKSTLEINQESGIVPNHILLFELVGIFMAKVQENL